MRTSLLCLLLAGLLTFGGCTSPAPPSANVQLDQLFTRLRTTASDEEAQAISVTIRHVWSQHRDAEIRTLMRHGIDAAYRGHYDAAVTILDEVVRRAPDFVEAWNLRATLYLARGDIPQALSDIEQVLTLEPRHFEALAGLGRIFLMLDDQRAALRAYEAALAINPHMKESREKVRELRDAVIGIAI